MTRPRLKIVCEEHDRVIAMVVDTDEGPAYGNRTSMIWFWRRQGQRP